MSARCTPGGRSACAQALAPALVRDNSQFAHDDGEQHSDWGQRLIGKTRNGNCNAGMARYRRKCEDGAVIFIGSAKKMANSEPKERDDNDGRKRPLAHHRALRTRACSLLINPAA